MKYFDTDAMSMAEESASEAASCKADEKASAKLMAQCVVFAKAVIATLLASAKRASPLPNGASVTPVFNDGFDPVNGDEICFNAFDFKGVRYVSVVYWQDCKVVASATVNAVMARVLFAKASALATDPWTPARAAEVMPTPWLA